MKYSIALGNQPNSKGSFSVVNKNGDRLNMSYRLRTIDEHMYLDLFLNDSPLFYSRRCVCLSPFILNNSLGGNFYFIDKQESSDPKIEGQNTRFKFIFDTDYVVN